VILPKAMLLWHILDMGARVKIARIFGSAGPENWFFLLCFKGL
jgi:hypothetical protein